MNEIKVNHINKINQIIDCSKTYLIQYYDELKSIINIEFETEINSIQNTQSKEETSKEWLKLIDIISKCLAQCINNTIPIEVINESKQVIDQSESINDYQLEHIKHRLQSYIFTNDSYFAVYISERKQILFAEEGLKSDEIEFFLKNYFSKLKFITYLLSIKSIHDRTIRSNKSKNTNRHRVEIINLESFRSYKSVILKANESRLITSHVSQLNGLRCFSNLKNIFIWFANIHNLDFISHLTSLKCFSIRFCNFKSSFNFDWLKDSPQLIKLDFRYCNLNEFNLNCLTNLTYLSLIDCKITELKKDSFVNLVNLKELLLSKNSGLSLEEGCFNGLSKLESLDLSQCNISQLKENTFVGLDTLLYLNLSDNKQIRLEQGCFDCLKRLINLNLTDYDLNEENEENEDIVTGLEKFKKLRIN